MKTAKPYLQTNNLSKTHNLEINRLSFPQQNIKQKKIVQRKKDLAPRDFLPIDEIICGDALTQMQHLLDKSFNMIFADPPYNLQIADKLQRPEGGKVDGVFNDWDKFSSFEAYDKFTYKWLSLARNLLHDNGTIWVIGSYHNIFRVGKIMQDLGFWILNDIIWHKSNPMPNFKGTRFTNAHETLIWAAKSKQSKYYFPYHSLKAGNEDVQMGSNWYGPICQGKERLVDDQGKKAHPTQKPLYLLERIIRTSTQKNDLILDPFFGTGTSGAAAKRLKRHFIGIEKEKDYVKVAQTRIADITPLKDELLNPYLGKQKQKIAFASLVEQKKLLPGHKLFSPCKKYSATINFDGTLYVEINKKKHYGSIHQLASFIKGRSINGWKYWNFKQNNQLLSLDELRSDIN